MVTRRSFIATGVVMASTAMTAEWASSPGGVSIASGPVDSKVNMVVPLSICSSNTVLT